MCNISCLDFGKKYLTCHNITGRRVLEVGSRDVNGSLRPYITQLGPLEYVGVDIENGPGVDKVCNVYDLAKMFEPNAFDVIVSTEMIEHVPDWKLAISNFKRVLKPEGILLLTTRSYGFPYHDYPGDFWRFEIEDMHRIFSDMVKIAIEPDETEPGVLVVVNKPNDFREADLSQFDLYSMVKGRRRNKVGKLDLFLFKFDRAFFQRIRNSWHHRRRSIRRSW